jgi:hypothetical protein
LEGSFQTLSLEMMQEFRRSGAIFVKHMTLSPEHVDLWQSLVLSPVEPYCNHDYIMRTSGDPIDFNAIPETDGLSQPSSKRM